MRRRVWKIATDAYHQSFSDNRGRYSIRSGPDTHIRYCWNGRAANIHGVALIMRVMVFGQTKAWFKEKWKAIDWSLVFYYGMLALSFGVLLFSLWAIADHEGML